MKTSRKNIATIISIIFLFLALLTKFPYGFYTLLRLIIFTSTVYLSYLAYRSEKKTWMWIFGFIAIVFNPLIPLHFKRSLWQMIDLLTMIFLFISIFTFKLSKEITNKTCNKK